MLSVHSLFRILLSAALLATTLHLSLGCSGQPANDAAIAARVDTLQSYLAEHYQTPEDYVISKFADHDIVFLGERHRLKHDVALVQDLIPLLHDAGVYHLGIEFARWADHDFAVQPLLPNRQSQFGPALAAADVDGDGDVDVFLGGSTGDSGQLLINDGTTFVTTSSSAWADDGDSEDVDAIFFDIDMDGDQDLFVVSGSNEWKPGARQYQDRVYLNDGVGHFSRHGCDARLAR